MSKVFLADYIFTIDNNDLVMDPELNLEQYGWNPGDFFRYENNRLVKVDSVELFLKGAKLNGA